MKKPLKYISFLVLTLILILGVVLFFNYYSNKPLGELEKKYKYTDSKTVNIVGMDVHYRETGEGAPILLIHGDKTSLHIWEKWTTELAKSYKVVSLDLPGYGLTGKHYDNDYSVKAYCDFLDVFLDKIGLQQIAMVGNGLGGEIAWQYTLEHKNRISKLVLMNSDGYVTKTNEASWEETVATTPYANQLMLSISPKSFASTNIKALYHDQTKVKEPIINRHHDLLLREGNRQAFIDQANQVKKDRSADIKGIEVPTLILWGKEDVVTPVEFANKFDRDISNTKLIIYDNVGHLPMDELPEISVNDVKMFLEN